MEGPVETVEASGEATSRRGCVDVRSHGWFKWDHRSGAAGRRGMVCKNGQVRESKTWERMGWGPRKREVQGKAWVLIL